MTVLLEDEIAEATETELLLDTRHNTHENYEDTARIAQTLKNVMRAELSYRHRRGQPNLSFKQLESLDLIMTKIARIIAGDNMEKDHWDDIAGYATLPSKDT